MLDLQHSGPTHDPLSPKDGILSPRKSNLPPHIPSRPFMGSVQGMKDNPTQGSELRQLWTALLATPPPGHPRRGQQWVKLGTSSPFVGHQEVGTSSYCQCQEGKEKD